MDEKKEVWMVIQCTGSTPEVDGKGAFVLGEDGKMSYKPDDKHWKPLPTDDVPEWVKEGEVIRDLMNGVRVSKNPDKDGRWYRGVRCEAPSGSIH